MALAAVGIFQPGLFNLTGSNDDAGSGAKLPSLPSPSQSSPSPSASLSRPAKDRVADIGNIPVNTPEIMALRPCTPSDLSVGMESTAGSYAPSDHPKFVVTIDNEHGESDCRVDLGRTSSEVAITTAEDEHVWSSSDCPPSGEPRWVRLAADEPVTETFRWNRTRSGPECTTPHPGEPVPGTYEATASVDGLTAHASFLLKPNPGADQPGTTSAGGGDGGSGDNSGGSGGGTDIGGGSSDTTDGGSATGGSDVGGTDGGQNGGMFGGSSADPSTSPTYANGGGSSSGNGGTIFGPDGGY